MGAGQCVGLLGGGALLGTLGGHGEEAHAEAVLVVELLLGTEESAERVVEGTFDDALVGPAVGEREGECPAVVHHTRRVGKDGAGQVVAVTCREGEVGSRGILRSTHVDVVGTADGGKGKAVVLKGRYALLVLGGVVESAYHAVAEAAGLHVVHQYAVDVSVVVLGVVAAHLEAHGAEQVAYVGEEDVVGR